ncbi:MAG: universal stress protein [Firmicutes bacterium]|nr:universal stress protein [Bacillota bacterium]
MVAYRGAEWIRTHVVPQTPVHLVAIVPPHTPVAGTARTVASHHLHGARQRLGKWSPVISAVRAGPVAEELARYAASVNATALLVGYKARSRTAERILGGVWTELWSKSPCPLVALLDMPAPEPTSENGGRHRAAFDAGTC